jgi:hypothetical protein
VAVPKPTAQDTPEDESQYTSPSSNDSLTERYAKVKAQDASLSTAERLKRLREGAKLFEEIAADKGKKADEA